MVLLGTKTLAVLVCWNRGPVGYKRLESWKKVDWHGQAGWLDEGSKLCIEPSAGGAGELLARSPRDPQLLRPEGIHWVLASGQLRLLTLGCQAGQKGAMSFGTCACLWKQLDKGQQL